MRKYLLSKSEIVSAKGVLLMFEDGIYTDMDSNKVYKYDDRFHHDFLELSHVRDCDILELKKMAKEKRLEFVQELKDDGAQDKMDANESEHKIRYFNSKIFLHRDSTIVDSKFTSTDDVTKNQLVKIGLNNNIYGTVTKTDDKYAVITLLPESLEAIKDNNPNCQFTNKFFEQNKSGVIVDKAYIEKIEGNLIFIEKRSIIDQKFIICNKTCESEQFSINEYVKFIDGPDKTVAIVQSSHMINMQPCLKVKIVKCEQDSEVFIRESAVSKVGLKSLTKFYEGVLIDPISIHNMQNCDGKSLKKGDSVQVSLRDNGELCSGTVVWIGKVNDFDVCAVKSAIKLSNSALQNLMCDGKFNGTEYFESTAYIIPISMVTKELPQNQITPEKINEITKYLKRNDITADVYDYLSFISENCVSRGLSPENFITQFFKLAIKFLKDLKRNFIVNKLEDAKSEVDNNDQLLIKCSMKVLHILSDLCIEYEDVAKKIVTYQPMLEILKNIFNNLQNHTYHFKDCKEIITNILFIFWMIIKNGCKDPDDWFTMMCKTFEDDNVDDYIRLLAAMSLALLIKQPNDCNFKLIYYLKEAGKKTFPDSRISKNDILIALGKIFSVCGFTLSSEDKRLRTTSNTIVSNDMVSKNPIDQSIKYAEEEFCASGSELTFEEYEECITKLVISDNSDASRDYLIKHLARMNNKEAFKIFIEKQPQELIYNNYKELISEINDPCVGAIIKKCDVTPNDYRHCLEMAKKYLKEGKIKNTEIMLGKMTEYNEYLDGDVLHLAYIAWEYNKLDIFKIALSKSKNINSFLYNDETFLTYIIKNHKDEDRIIQAIELGEFELKTRNQEGYTPVKLANDYLLQKVLNFIWSKGVVEPDDFFKSTN